VSASSTTGASRAMWHAEAPTAKPHRFSRAAMKASGTATRPLTRMLSVSPSVDQSAVRSLNGPSLANSIARHCFDTPKPVGGTTLTTSANSVTPRSYGDCSYRLARAASRKCASLLLMPPSGSAASGGPATRRAAARRPNQQRAGAPSRAPGLLLRQEAGVSACASARRGMKIILGRLLSGPDRTVGRSGTGAFWENAAGQAALDDALRARACLSWPPLRLARVVPRARIGRCRSPAGSPRSIEARRWS
jgi:hypothetical protein